MSLVVDASVAVRWTIEMPLSDRAEALLATRFPLIAPDLVIAEVTNAFVFHFRNGLDQARRAEDGLEFLPRWFSELVPAAKLRQWAFALAVELEHSAYDCFYLALAEARRTRLVTTDEHFIRKAQGSEHARVIVHLADWRP